MKTKVSFVSGRPQQQRGVALIVVLILLMVMTLLGIYSMRGTLLEERMSANQVDRNFAFQSAEAALREGEVRAATKPVMPADGVCSAGLCGIPIPTNQPVWLNERVWSGAPAATTDLGDAAVSAQYIVEVVAKDVVSRVNCPTTGDVTEVECTGKETRYRISARSRAAGRADVIVQTTYAVP